MNILVKNQINYFNEALLLATYVVNVENNKDFDLPIKVQNLILDNESIDNQDQDLVNFLKNSRYEARAYLEKKSEISIYFKNFKESNSSEILYFLTYSKLEQSIENYKKEELFIKIKTEFIKNMVAQGYDFSEQFTFEEVDKLVIFSEQQRYAIYKLLHNINGTYDSLYETFVFLEKIIKRNIVGIKKKVTGVYKKLENLELHKIDKNKILEPIIKGNNIESVEVTLLIQFSEIFGFSLFEEDKTKEIKGYLLLGLVPFEFHETTYVAEENKNEMFNKFSLLSDTTRFNIIVLLSEGAMYGRQISEYLNISTGTISHHLSNLLQEKIIVSEVKGKRIYYSLNISELNRMSRFLKQLGEKKCEK